MVGQYVPVPPASQHARIPPKISNLNRIVMNLSAITAAIPSLHRFLNDLQHGALGTRITEHQYELSQGSSNGMTGKFGLSKAGSRRDDVPKSHPSLQGSSSRLSSRIFSDHAIKCGGRGAMERNHDPHNHIPEDRSTSSLTNNRVLQTWEISIEVENNQKRDTSVATSAETL